MNAFLASTKRMIQKHGMNLVYNSVTTSAYNVETGSPSKTVLAFNTRMYPRHLIATVYNYPTLVGKETYEFYLTNDNLGFYPKFNDEINYQDTVYRVQTYQEHVALGEIVLFRIIATRG